jgi:peptidoglycan hydrolase-like protein with peptidoglycan-binding domain
MLNGMASSDSIDELPQPSPHNGMLKVVQLSDLLSPQAEGLEGTATPVDLPHREVIRQVQRQLRAGGFHPGSIDGHLGPRTEKALLAYQHARRLPKTGRLDELTLRSLDVKDVPEQNDQLLHASPAEITPGSTATGLHAGDLLLLSGWIQQASRDPDGTYRLQLSPHQKARTPALTAVVPHPDQASGSSPMQAQFQTVRTFITAQLLRQQEPSPRGSVMRSPTFVQLSGQLSSAAPPPAESPQARRSGGATAQWEMRPVLDIQFATPPPQ